VHRSVLVSSMLCQQVWIVCCQAAEARRVVILFIQLFQTGFLSCIETSIFKVKTVFKVKTMVVCGVRR
jgi:hypothetical protein